MPKEITQEPQPCTPRIGDQEWRNGYNMHGISKSGALMGSQLGLAAFLGRRDSPVDGVRRAAEQQSPRRRSLPAAAAWRLDPPAGAVVVDGAGEVERLAPLPHQDRPPPKGALLLPAAPAIAGSATAVSRHELPAEAGAAAPTEPTRAEEPAREAARAGGHGDGHFAQEAAAGHGAPRGRWCKWKVQRKCSNLPGGGSHLLIDGVPDLNSPAKS